MAKSNNDDLLSSWVQGYKSRRAAAEPDANEDDTGSTTASDASTPRLHRVHRDSPCKSTKPPASSVEGHPPTESQTPVTQTRPQSQDHTPSHAVDMTTHDGRQDHKPSHAIKANPSLGSSNARRSVNDDIVMIKPEPASNPNNQLIPAPTAFKRELHDDPHPRNMTARSDDVPSTVAAVEAPVSDVSKLETCNGLIERIVGTRFNVELARREWLVRWKGYSKSDDTWEPLQHIDGTEAYFQFESARDKAIQVLKDQSKHMRDRFEKIHSDTQTYYKKVRERYSKLQQQLKKKSVECETLRALIGANAHKFPMAMEQNLRNMNQKYLSLQQSHSTLQFRFKQCSEMLVKELAKNQRLRRKNES